MENPDTRYAWNGDIALAYQVLGDGPIDLVYLQGWISNVELNWENPRLARFLRETATLGRLIVSDRRGWGCSERFSPIDVPPLETLIDDLTIVMDAVGSERAVLVASLECTAIATLFAATQPKRVSGLVLIDPWATFTQTEETRRRTLLRTGTSSSRRCGRCSRCPHGSRVSMSANKYG